MKVGDFIRDELEARGWDVERLLQVRGFRLGRTTPVDETKRYKLAIDLLIHTDGPLLDGEIAGVLANGFGTSKQLWINLDSQLRALQARAAQAALTAVRFEELLAAARSVLYHDERGQGVQYVEAMQMMALAIAKIDAEAKDAQPVRR